jgi:hypothetical protein
VPVGNPEAQRPLADIRPDLSAMYAAAHDGKVPSKSALGDAMMTLEASPARTGSPRGSEDGELEDSDSSLAVHWLDRLGPDQGPVRLYPHRFGDGGWFDRSPLHPGWLAALWQHTGDPADAARLERLRAEAGYEWRGFRPFRDKEDAGHEDAWYSFVTGRDDRYPEEALSGAQAQVRHRLALLDAYGGRPVTERDIHLWQQVNPVTTEVLSQLTLGAPQMLYNGGLMQARVRYFDAARRRPGLPAGVTALVSRVNPRDTVLDLVNMDGAGTASVLVQAGAYGESEIIRGTYTRAHSAGPGPGTQVRLRLVIRQRTRRPGYTSPWGNSG